jgi:hypothetical protein
LISIKKNNIYTYGWFWAFNDTFNNYLFAFGKTTVPGKETTARKSPTNLMIYMLYHSSENKQFNARATTCARIVTENSAYLLLLKTYEGGGSGDMAAPVSCFLVDNVTSGIYNSKHQIKTASEQIYPVKSFNI